MNLSAKDIGELRAAGWDLLESPQSVQKTYVFEDFTAAFAFMTQAAIWAEKWNHHPDWSNSYRRVVVELTTHDVGGLSDLDLKLARKMDEIAGQ